MNKFNWNIINSCYIILFLRAEQLNNFFIICIFSIILSVPIIRFWYFHIYQFEFCAQLDINISKNSLKAFTCCDFFVNLKIFCDLIIFKILQVIALLNSILFLEFLLLNFEFKVLNLTNFIKE